MPEMSEPLKPEGCKPVVCIGWPTIRKLAAGEDIETPAGILIAADGLHGCVVAPSPVVAEVVKEMRAHIEGRRAVAAGLGVDLLGPHAPIYHALVIAWADRLERGE